MELEEFKHFISKVEGLTWEEDCFFLYALTKDLKSKADILDIGSYKGRVSISLAQALRDAGEEGKVYAIESNFLGSKQDLLRNIERFGLKDLVVPIFKHSAKANRDWNKPFKLIWIDTGGSYFSYKCDFLLWEPYLVKGGIIAFGDYCGSVNVKRAVDDCIMGSDRFGEIKTAGRIAFAYKHKECPAYLIRKIEHIRLLYGFFCTMKKISYVLRDKSFFSWLKASSLKNKVNKFFEKRLRI